MPVAEQLQQIISSLPPHVTLVAVSKTHPAEKVQEAYKAGHRDFGENRVQELIFKAPLLPDDIRWHLIGHLQTNKVKAVIPFVHLIHSVDSERLMAEISKQAVKQGKTVSCLIQVHIASEETKYGFSTEEAREFLISGKAAGYAHVKVKGLMGMASLTENQEQVRREFRQLNSLFEELKASGLPLEMLSMGMSGDYRIAIEEGSTMIRIGTSIFGTR